MLIDQSFEYQSVCDQSYCAWRRFHPPGGYTQWQLRNSYPYAYYGTWFLRFHSEDAAGGSVYQDMGNIYPSPGDSYVFSIYMRAPSGCVNVSLVLWGVGLTDEPNTTRLNICNNVLWTNVRVPLDAQLANGWLRAQIYLDEKDKQLDIDHGEVIQVMHENASFESANFCDSCAWRRIHPTPHPPYDTNWLRYQDLNRNANASGEWYLEMNRTGGAGTASSLYQDIPVVVSPGQRYVFKVWMRQGPPWPAPLLYGTLKLWALDGSPAEYASYNFTLSSSYWSEYTIVLNVNQTHPKLRAEIYLTNPQNTNFDFDGTRVYRSQ
jgi:hypothetical protein